EAGQAGITAAGDAAAELASGATERGGEVAIEVRRTAKDLRETVLGSLPAIVRETTRRSVEAIEETGARAAVSVIDTGTKMLSAAADYVSELAPRRRVRHEALEDVVTELLRWVHLGTEALDRTIDETPEVETRTQLVRFKMQTIKQAEILTVLLTDVGGRVPAEERATPAPSTPPRRAERARSVAAERQGLGHALTVAVQVADGWRALDRIAASAARDRISQAIQRARELAGSQPEEQVTFLQQALVDATVRMVLA
ncbi:MAG TPA: hypothetical protein VKA21_13495, partial [Candidatus Binatia bacterium]|nr:hypothetical protein [Candidatus Binatia bacterium]